MGRSPDSEGSVPGNQANVIGARLCPPDQLQRVSIGGTGDFLRLTQAEALRLILRIQPRSGVVPGGTD